MVIRKFFCSLFLSLLLYGFVNFPLKLQQTALANSNSKQEVNFPSTLSNPDFGSTRYILNGVGIRKKLVFKVYAGALYLEEKNSNADKIIESNSPKHLVMHFLRDVDSEAVQKALSESFQKGCASECSTYNSNYEELNTILKGLGSFKKGNELAFSLLPSGSVKVHLNSKSIGEAGSKSFSKLFLQIFLGNNPPSADLKNGMLGN